MNIRAETPAQTTHVAWLSDWLSTRASISSLVDDSPEEARAYEHIEALSVRLASGEAETLEDLQAQVAWLSEELADVVATWASPEHAQVFDVIQNSLIKMGANQVT